MIASECLSISFVLALTCYQVACSSILNNQLAPAKVNLTFTISKFNQELTSEPIKFQICVDKYFEKCFWQTNEDIVLGDELFKEVDFSFYISNIDTDLTISIQIKNGQKTINFSRKPINLKKLNPKDYFEFHSLTLESFVKMTITHECESGYYPPRQCTKFCLPITSQYSCDKIGNKICKEGLYYDSKDEKCLSNNCLKSSIQCFNNGLCVNKGSTFECQCLESYIGKFCEFTNPCYPNPCQNNGTCFVKETRNSFICSCPKGYIGSQCGLKVYKPCSCPANMKCNYSESGVLFSCTSESAEDVVRKKTMESESKDTSQIDNTKMLESKKYQEWKYVSLTTTIVAAVGCLMILICIVVTVYVFHHTKSYSRSIKSNNLDNSPSTLYTQFTPQFNQGTFKRAMSLDDNSLYLPSNSVMMTNTQGLLTLGSNTGFSINSNSYQENPAVSLLNYPTYSEMNKHDLRPRYLIMNRNCMETSNTDTLSSGGLPTPPALPPRPSNETGMSNSPTQNSV